MSVSISEIKSELTEEEKKRYNAAYCRLCHTLGSRHGISARSGMQYDLTFLILLHSSLYESYGVSKSSTAERITEHAADMTAVLNHIMTNDEANDGTTFRHGASSTFAAAYENIRSSEQMRCERIEREASRLSSGELSYSEASAAFGRMVEETFWLDADGFELNLRRIGRSIGRYVCLSEVISSNDRRRRRSVFSFSAPTPEEVESINSLLSSTLGEARDAFDRLPLKHDVRLMRNIMDSGLWLRYNGAMERRKTRCTKKL